MHTRMPVAVGLSQAEQSPEAEAAALAREEAALVARLPSSLRAPIFLPTARLTPAARVAGLRRVVDLYDGRWAAAHRPRLAALRDRHKGRRVFVLGNGPSLGRIDLDSLADQVTIGVNGLFLAFPQTRFRPTYYLVEDHLVAEDRAAALNGLPAGLTRLFPITLAYALDEGPDVVWFDHRPRPGYPDRFDVSLDALSCTYAGCTVAFTAVQLAVFLGAREVVLLGVDLDYAIPADATRTAGGAGAGPGVLDMASDDPNHFHPDYFGKGKRWHDPQVENMGRAFAAARDALAGLGARLINGTPGGRMDLVPRVPLDRVLADSTAPAPRLLVLDLTPVGGLSATGQVKAALMAPWCGGRLLAITPDGAPDRFTVHHPDGRAEAGVDAGTAAARARAFAPEALYYRPQPTRGHLHPLALDLVEGLGAPLILHLMDDWPALLARTDPLVHQVWAQDLAWLAGRAAVRLGIGASMVVAFRDRYGGGTWEALANGIDPADWPARDRSPGAGCPDRPFDLLYAGALAEDMNRAAVRDVADAVDALNRAAGRPLVRLELRVLPPWIAPARALAADRSGVVATVADDPDPAPYRARLCAADGVLIAYAFDEDSRLYTRHSLANTLPEALASGAAVFGYGPAEQATLAALAESGAAVRVTERDPAALRAALSGLVSDPALAARLGAAGRAHACEAYALAPRRDRLRTLVRGAAAGAGRRVLSADHPRLDGARLDETALLLGLARFQTTAPGLLVDVGAHRGGFLTRFLEAGWSGVAVEPEPDNRAALRARVADAAAVTVEPVALSDAPAAAAPLYTAPDSTGVATLAPFLDGHRETARVPVETLTTLLERHGMDAVDVLKVDAEGWDLRVLLGLDWARWRPRVVMAEFENRKTLRLGWSLGDLVALLEGRGYRVFVSEWHPVVRYGARHDWRRLIPWPPGDADPLPDPDGWGNVIAVCPDAGLPNDDALAGMVRAALTLDPRPEPVQDTDPVAPLETRPGDPAAAPTPAPDTTPLAAPPAAPAPSPLPPPDPWWRRGRGLAGEMAAVLGGWRAPLAGGLVVAAGAAPLVPWPGSSLLAALAMSGALGFAAYGHVRGRRLERLDRHAAARAQETKLKRHVGWLRDDLAGLEGRLAAEGAARAGPAATLAADLATARDAERRAREDADRHVEAALTRHLGRVRDALAAALAAAEDRLAAAEDRLGAGEQEVGRLAGRVADGLAAQAADLAAAVRFVDRALVEAGEALAATASARDLEAATGSLSNHLTALDARQARDRRGLAETVSGMRADLAREGAARDAAWQAAVTEAERAAARGDRAVAASLTGALADDRQRTGAALAGLRGRLEEQSLAPRLAALRCDLEHAGALGAARFQPFPRGLSDTDVARLRTVWLPALGLPDMTPRALGYLAERLLARERAGGGRLACALPAALLRALAARASPGPDLRALEVGVLFGLGLAVLAAGVEGQGRRLRLLGLDPLDGGSYGAAADPVTGAPVTAPMVRAVLARAGLPRHGVTLVRRRSDDPVALARVRAWARPDGLGLLVLDGRHDRAGLAADWARFAPLLRPGGLALIDDVGAAAWPDVAPFVREVAATTPGVRLLGTDWETAVLRREAVP
ncbi:FkbM family methyltransferase [Roseospira goensis]|uniref:FkbM family methyltransferase n=1 Tax=Roseospira goensis TaxID=391922 RepID=A0A7W6S051_9PROT|nr:FkbM family methyltransferase [Roseospira goensis]MBB4285834.1 FkbM family methyltransferase [Roseospira goensis]